MAEDEQKPGAEPNQQLSLPPSFQLAVHDAYSNNSRIIIGKSEVAIAFLQDIGFSNSTPPAPQKPIVRIVMTHSQFLNFSDYCNSRAKFIQDGYDGPIPDIATKERTDEEINKSYEDMNSRRPVVVKFEFVEEVSEK